MSVHFFAFQSAGVAKMETRWHGLIQGQAKLEWAFAERVTDSF